MKICILNCDLDEHRETNGGHLLQNCIKNSELIDCINNIDELNINKYDGFIITGSRANFDDEHSWLKILKKILLELKHKNIPCLGICFGMQLFAGVCDGEVLSNKVNESGYYSIEITPNNLFENLPKEIQIYESHQDVVSKIPIGAEIIAINENCIQGFKLNNFYGVQFHPEISTEVATLMANRDGDNLEEIMGGVNINYKLPSKIIDNFVKIVENYIKTKK